MLRALHFSHVMLSDTIQQFPNGVFVDGTLGKGNDIAYILSHKDFTGHAYGFDIQPQAIALTQQKLATLPSEHYTLLCDSHATIDHHLAHEPVIHGAIYNLGYLPGGDHAITTTSHSTLQSIHQVAAKLIKNGKIILVIYSGHPQGQAEKAALLDELATWPQEHYQVLHYGFINQRNNPPFLLIIEKIAD